MDAVWGALLCPADREIGDLIPFIKWFSKAGAEPVAPGVSLDRDAAP